MNCGFDGLLTNPSGWKISPFDHGNVMRTSAGSATQSPTVETRRTVGVRSVSRRKRMKYRSRPNSGATTRIVNGAAKGMRQPCFVLSQQEKTATVEAIAPWAKLNTRDDVYVSTRPSAEMA